MRVSQIFCLKLLSPLRGRARVGLKPLSPLHAQAEPQVKPASPLRVRNECLWRVFRLQRCHWFQWLLFRGEQWWWRFHTGLHQRSQWRCWLRSRHVAVSCARKSSPCKPQMGEKRCFQVCWANFFAEVPVVGLCWANFFAGSVGERVCWTDFVASTGIVAWHHR